MADDLHRRVERLEQTNETISVKLELIITQTRSLIQQNDRLLEFMDALNTGLVEAGQPESAADADPSLDQKMLYEALSALMPEREEEKDPRQPGWGYDAYRERIGREGRDE